MEVTRTKAAYIDVPLALEVLLNSNCFGFCSTPYSMSFLFVVSGLRFFLLIWILYATSFSIVYPRMINPTAWGSASKEILPHFDRQKRWSDISTSWNLLHNVMLYWDLTIHYFIIFLRQNRQKNDTQIVDNFHHSISWPKKNSQNKQNLSKAPQNTLIKTPWYSLVTSGPNLRIYGLAKTPKELLNQNIS